MPEPNNHEQYMNAHFLHASGAGRSIAMDELSPEIILEFLDKLDVYRSHIDRDRLFGNPQALAIINRYLPESQPFSEPVAALRGLESMA
jgi:UDP-N-acetylglucosamine:LPS N-acetylglucosamine transferase